MREGRQESGNGERRKSHCEERERRTETTESPRIASTTGKSKDGKEEDGDETVRRHHGTAGTERRQRCVKAVEIREDVENLVFPSLPASFVNTIRINTLRGNACGEEDCPEYRQHSQYRHDKQQRAHEERKKKVVARPVFFFPPLPRMPPCRLSLFRRFLELFRPCNRCEVVLKVKGEVAVRRGRRGGGKTVRTEGGEAKVDIDLGSGRSRTETFWKRRVES